MKATKFMKKLSSPNCIPGALEEIVLSVLNGIFAGTGADPSKCGWKRGHTSDCCICYEFLCESQMIYVDQRRSTGAANLPGIWDLNDDRDCKDFTSSESSSQRETADGMNDLADNSVRQTIESIW